MEQREGPLKKFILALRKYYGDTTISVGIIILWSHRTTC